MPTGRKTATHTKKITKINLKKLKFTYSTTLAIIAKDDIAKNSILQKNSHTKLCLNNFCLRKVGSIINHFQNKLLIELFVCRCKKVLRNFLNLRMVVIARFVDKKCSVFIISLDCRCLLYLQPFCFLLLVVARSNKHEYLCIVLIGVFIQ